jgi:hypothetical protein
MKAEIFVKVLQRGPVSVDPLPEAHIPAPVFNGVKICLQTGRPGDGPIVEGVNLRFNRRSDGIKDRAKNDPRAPAA